MSHLVYFLEYRWNLWLASEQQNLTKIMGCYSHDYISHVRLLATGERDIGIEVFCWPWRSKLPSCKSIHEDPYGREWGAASKTWWSPQVKINKNLRTSVKKSWGNEHWQQPKWTWNPIFPQLSDQNKMQPGPHHDHSLLWPGAVSS